MNSMGYCETCREPVPINDLIMHITQNHATPKEYWPDGETALFDMSLEPADFMDDAALRLFDMAENEPLSFWDRCIDALRRLFKTFK